MTINLAGASDILVGAQDDRFLREGLDTYGIAAHLTTQVNCVADSVSFPRIATSDDVAWVTEGSELSDHGITFDDVVVTPAKVGAVTSVTNEVFADVQAGGGMSAMILDSLTTKIAKAVDAAFFGDLNAPAPSGLESLDDATIIDAGTALANTDPFVEAVANAQGRGVNLTGFAAHPDDALAMARLKRAEGSNESLLDVTQADGKVVRTISGVPLVTSPEITRGHIWGLPASRVYLVLRAGTKVVKSDDALFSSDRTMLRGTSRVGFGFVDEPAIQKIVVAAGE